uniref:RING-type domain-containing protein n=1 Tax=Panagrellus redivivus TaxID=6233 RepID=A0A7E4UUU9_PANRE
MTGSVVSFGFRQDTRTQIAMTGASTANRPTAPGSTVKLLCEICLEMYNGGEFQQLACGHSFCNTCISMCTATVLCPHPMCSSVRSMDIVVDEADEPFDPDLDHEDDAEGLAEKHHNRIAFAARLPLVMRLEEKQRCEARRGRFQCANVARITLTACRHSTCFDCIGRRLELIAKYTDPITCPLPRCSNKLTKTEIKRVSERPAGNFTTACTQIMARMKDDPPREERLPAKDEVRVYCSIHGSDVTTKLLYLSVVCTFGDMINAFMQVLKLDKGCVPSEMHIYVRSATDNGKTKFEQLNLKQMSKKPIRDSLIVDKTHVVFDLKNEIGRQ